MRMLDVRLYLAQRISALLLVPFVMTHLVIILIAIRGGLTVNEILGRTQGSYIWFLFYGAFVLSASVHGAIGFRVIVHETFGIGKSGLSVVTWGLFTLLTILGLRAVWAVTFAGLAA